MPARHRTPTPGYISTGRLPPDDQLARLVREAHARFASFEAGANAADIPALARVPSWQFGVCLAGTSGSLFNAGDADVEFTMQSVSKPFVFALVCAALGEESARQMLGVNASGLPFNSILAIELNADRTVNPLVNAGAIATTSLVPGATIEAKWRAIQSGLSRFAGRELSLNDEVYRCESANNARNDSMARLLESYGRLHFDAAATTDLYTRQCALNVTAVDLAVMGATLANGGVNPRTQERVIEPLTCHHVLAVMASAGFYERSGDWLWDIGLPGKSGVSGGIVAVAPGKGGLGTFSPPLDDAGNSVKGQLVARFFSQRLGLNLFISEPRRRRAAKKDETRYEDCTDSDCYPD